MSRVLIATLTALGLATSAFSQHEFVVTEDDFEPRVYSPYADRTYPDKVLFGDTHLHTKYSPDAGLLGTTLSPADVYRFARGESVTSNTGQRVQLVRPLDFLVVTDHAEYIGLAPMIRNADPLLLADDFGRWMYEQFTSGPEGAAAAFRRLIDGAEKGVNEMSSDAAVKSIWSSFVKTADEYDEPGSFAAMIGFEWSSVPNGNNVHRVVVFRDGADKTSQVVPFTLFDSPDPEDLWKYLSAYVDNTGGRAIAIPHNGNLSNGLMFAETTQSGQPITRAYAEERMRWEPIIEVTQMKGDGETHPLLSPDDEFADYETWAVSNLSGNAPKEDWMLQYEYGRSALRVGLKLAAELGVNPYQFGMSAATDTHTGLATSREENYFGKFAKAEPKGDRHDYVVIPTPDPSLRIMSSQELASGLTAVWARETTREAIFDAMERKEVYATTGTRLRVRVFGGWDFDPNDVSRHDFTMRGYSKGVPMGGELEGAPSGGAPEFIIRALRDPDGANLDRVQIIKGWLDANGDTHERIYDVAVSDGRQIGADGRAREPVGNTVDLDTATFTNTIGAPILTAHWQDPDFDASEHAFYYVRVLEIPTPRWTTYDAAFYGVPRPTNVPATTQDRAYTSPIWYTPN